MVSIRWFYERTGPGQVADIVSHAAPVQAELKEQANRIAANASAILASEPKVRTGDSQVDTFQADLDYYVVLKDPSIGKRMGGAAGIEKHFGVLGRSV